MTGKPIRRRGFFVFACILATLSAAAGGAAEPLAPNPVREIHSFATDSPRQKFRAWALGLSFVLATTNGELTSPATLSLFDPERADFELKARVMQASWGATDHDSLVGNLRWLLDGRGHSADYVKFERLFSASPGTAARGEESGGGQDAWKLAMYRQHSAELGRRALGAWDYGRLVYLCRGGYSLGWLSEAEAWQWIETAGAAARDMYSSWRDFARGYVIGRMWWSGKEAALSRYLQAERASVVLLGPKGGYESVPWDWAYQAKRDSIAGERRIAGFPRQLIDATAPLLFPWYPAGRETVSLFPGDEIGLDVAEDDGAIWAVEALKAADDPLAALVLSLSVDGRGQTSSLIVVNRGARAIFIEYLFAPLGGGTKAANSGKKNLEPGETLSAQADFAALALVRAAGYGAAAESGLALVPPDMISRTTIEAAMSPAAGGTKAMEPGTERRPTQVRSFFGQMQCCLQGLSASTTLMGASRE